MSAARLKFQFQLHLLILAEGADNGCPTVAKILVGTARCAVREFSGKRESQRTPQRGVPTRSHCGRTQRMLASPLRA